MKIATWSNILFIRKSCQHCNNYRNFIPSHLLLGEKEITGRLVIKKKPKTYNPWQMAKKDYKAPQTIHIRSLTKTNYKKRDGLPSPVSRNKYRFSYACFYLESYEFWVHVVHMHIWPNLVARDQKFCSDLLMCEHLLKPNWLGRIIILKPFLF